MRKLRKRAGSLLLAMFMLLSSFTPYSAYGAGGVAAGSNVQHARVGRNGNVGTGG